MDMEACIAWPGCREIQHEGGEYRAPCRSPWRGRGWADHSLLHRWLERQAVAAAGWPLRIGLEETVRQLVVSPFTPCRCAVGVRYSLLLQDSSSRPTLSRYPPCSSRWPASCAPPSALSPMAIHRHIGAHAGPDDDVHRDVLCSSTLRMPMGRPFGPAAAAGGDPRSNLGFWLKARDHCLQPPPETAGSASISTSRRVHPRLKDAHRDSFQLCRGQRAGRQSWPTTSTLTGKPRQVPSIAPFVTMHGKIGRNASPMWSANVIRNAVSSW